MVFSRTTVLVVFFIIIFVGYGLFSLIGKSIDAAKGRKLAEAEAAELAKKQEDLSLKLSDLNTADGQEATLREQFPVVKEGEHVVVITGDDSDQSASIATLSNDTEHRSFWSFLRNLFKQ